FPERKTARREAAASGRQPDKGRNAKCPARLPGITRQGLAFRSAPKGGPGMSRLGFDLLFFESFAMRYTKLGRPRGWSSRARSSRVRHLVGCLSVLLALACSGGDAPGGGDNSGGSPSTSGGTT